MCQFNLAIIDSEAEESKLKSIFERNNLYFSRINIKSLEQLLKPNERVIFTTKSHCDCGSVIGSDSKDNSNKRDIEREIRKLKRKKWSTAKIERYLADKEKDQERKQSSREESEMYELENWKRTVVDCFNESETKKFGILTHFFSGDIKEEKFTGLERTVGKIESFDWSDLRQLDFDNLTIISRF